MLDAGICYDVVIVGAGPSGSACAALLSRQGAKVLLLDKARFPRDKPCGDAIGGKALNVIAELGLTEKLKRAGFLRNSGVVFSSPSGEEVEIPLLEEGRELSGGFVCRRMDFDAMLFENAKKSCDAFAGTEVVDLILDGGKVVGVRAQDEGGARRDYYAKVVVGADGAGSLVARKTGVARHDSLHLCSAVRGYYSGIAGLRGNIEVHFLPECMPGYFWIFPLSSGSANVGVGMLLSDIKRKKINLWRVLETCMKNKRFKERFARAKLEGELKGWVLPLASIRRKCAGDGFVLIGDAASLVDPFSGEGIGNGMKSAKIAAEKILEALPRGPVCEADCLSYESALWKEIGQDVQASYRMQQLGRHSFLLDFLIGRAKKSWRLRNELAGMIASREAKKKASDPMFYLRALFS